MELSTYLLWNSIETNYQSFFVLSATSTFTGEISSPGSQEKKEVSLFFFGGYEVSISRLITSKQANQHVQTDYLLQKRKIIVCLTMWSLWMWIATFQLHTAWLLQVMRLIEYASSNYMLLFSAVIGTSFRSVSPLWSAAKRLSCCCVLLSLLMLLGWSHRWIASFTLHV